MRTLSRTSTSGTLDAGRTGMKHALLACVVATLASVAHAQPPPPAGPDFLELVPPRAVDQSVTASDGTNQIAPTDIVGFARGAIGLDDVALAQVTAAAKWMRRHPSFHIAIEGQADIGGNSDRARDLASRRADMVRKQLIGWGISSDRILVLVSSEPGARATMFASDQPVAKIATAALDARHAIAATWTDRGTLFQEEPGLGGKKHEAIATRK
jgi:outer membrane protein OmpA-like peptidoglycan-associated protein